MIVTSSSENVQASHFEIMMQDIQNSITRVDFVASKLRSLVDKIYGEPLPEAPTDLDESFSSQDYYTKWGFYSDQLSQKLTELENTFSRLNYLA
jgi:hypothetical protein